MQHEPRVRAAAVAGQFYPRSPERLRGDVEAFLTEAGKVEAGAPKALIAPHAGYVYSGSVAASAFVLAPEKARVVLLGPSHFVPLAGLAVSSASAWSTPLGEVFEKRHGVCQDFAHVMIAGLRGLGLPAAYVSGYLRTIPPPGQPRLQGADATHAWVSVWCGEGIGWIGFDPTNDLLVENDHIILAIGRDFSDVSPVDGIIVGSRKQKLNVAVDVLLVE